MILTVKPVDAPVLSESFRQNIMGDDFAREFANVVEESRRELRERGEPCFIDSIPSDKFRATVSKWQHLGKRAESGQWECRMRKNCKR